MSRSADLPPLSPIADGSENELALALSEAATGFALALGDVDGVQRTALDTLEALRQLAPAPVEPSEPIDAEIPPDPTVPAVSARAVDVATAGGIEAALALLAGAPGLLLVRSATSLAADVDLPAGVDVEFITGGEIDLAGFSLRIRGHVSAPPRLIFRGAVLPRADFLHPDGPHGSRVLLDRQPRAHPEWWGADPTGGADSAPAIEAAIHSRPRTGSSTSAPAVMFGAGLYSCDAPVQVKATVTCLGVGRVNVGAAASRLLWRLGTAGIVVHRAETIGQGATAAIGGHDPAAGSGSAFFGLSLEGVKGDFYAPTVDHGFEARARFRLSRCALRNWTGRGVSVIGSTKSTDPARLGNANGFVLEDLYITSCAGEGVYCDGTDVNAGVGSVLYISDCGGSGLYDSSYLGNLWTGFHIATSSRASMVSHNGFRYYAVPGAQDYATTEPGTDPAVWQEFKPGSEHALFPAWTEGVAYRSGGAIRADNANCASLFVGYYTEGGQAPSHITAARSEARPCLDGAGFSEATSCSVFSFAQYRRRVSTVWKTEAGNYSSTLGSPYNNDPETLASFLTPGEGSRGLDLVGAPTVFAWVHDRVRTSHYVTTVEHAHGGGYFGTESILLGSIVIDSGAAPPDEAAPDARPRADGSVRYNTAPAIEGDGRVLTHWLRVAGAWTACYSST